MATCAGRENKQASRVSLSFGRPGTLRAIRERWWMRPVYFRFLPLYRLLEPGRKPWASRTEFVAKVLRSTARESEIRSEWRAANVRPAGRNRHPRRPAGVVALRPRCRLKLSRWESWAKRKPEQSKLVPGRAAPGDRSCRWHSTAAYPASPRRLGSCTPAGALSDVRAGCFH